MMVEYAASLEDREERNALCAEIVRIMASLKSDIKDTPDFRQKLWDHLYHLGEYNLDIDSEYPMPPPDVIGSKAKEPMGYPGKRSRFRIYGRNVELMVEKAMELTDQDERDNLVSLIANIMKMHLKNNNERDGSAEMAVVEHLKQMSKGELDYSREDLNFYHRSQSAPSAPSGGMKYTQRNKGYQKQNRNRNRKNRK